MFSRILVPIDGSDASMRAVDVAGRLATAFEAELFLLHVVDEGAAYPLPPGLEQLARMESMAQAENHYLVSFTEQMMTRAASRAQALAVQSLNKEVRVGRPSATIVAFAKEKAVDLIVMGRHGTGSVSEALMGGVAHRVMQLTDCACLTVR